MVSEGRACQNGVRVSGFEVTGQSLFESCDWSGILGTVARKYFELGLKTIGRFDNGEAKPIRIQLGLKLWQILAETCFRSLNL